VIHKTVYLRKRRGKGRTARTYNVEFATFEAVKGLRGGGQIEATPGDSGAGRAAGSPHCISAEGRKWAHGGIVVGAGNWRG